MRCVAVDGTPTAEHGAGGRADPRRRRGAWLLTVVLLAVAAVCLGLAVSGQNPGPVRATPPTGTSTSGSPSPHAETSPPASEHASEPASKPASVPVSEPATSPPAQLLIPTIGVSARVIRLGLNADRTVEVPTDPATTGWYRLGAVPGAEGSAVILGHVDSVDGPAVFYRLRFLVPGDRIVVRAADGSAARFRVTEVATYPNDEFPAQRVYGPHGDRHALQLVTCGGDYDPESGYQANVVVYSRLVSGGG